MFTSRQKLTSKEEGRGLQLNIHKVSAEDGGVLQDCQPLRLVTTVVAPAGSQAVGL